MYHKITSFMEQHHMMDNKAAMVVGLSGGADSMCLLYHMKKYCEERHISLLALHVHHGIRGREADRDEEFCREYCKAQGIAYRSEHVNVPSFAGEYGLSEEEAARLLRYDVLRKAAGEFEEMYGREQAVIAVAHHRNDQAETVLFHLCRGTDIRGLRGMIPVNGKIIRPLLCVSREEILDFCETNGISYCTDSTNSETDYTRNCIRHEILPVLTERVNSETVEHLALLGERIGRVEDYLEIATGEAYATHAQEEICDGVLRGIFLAGLETLHPYMTERILYRSAVKLLGQAKDLTAEQVLRAARLTNPQVTPGTVEQLRQGLIARKEQDGIYLTKPGCAEYMEMTEGELSFTVIDCRNEAACAGEGILPLHPQESERILHSGDYTKYFDYDKINSSLRLRHREEGDYLVVDGSGHEKSLNRYFIDAKIPSRLRDRIWLLADGHHIVWIIGGRISEAVKVTSDTERLLKVTYNTFG